MAASHEALSRMEARLRESGGLVLSPTTSRTMDALGAADVLEVRRTGNESAGAAAAAAAAEEMVALPEEMVGPVELARRSEWARHGGRAPPALKSGDSNKSPVVTVHQGAPPTPREPVVRRVYHWDWLQVLVMLATVGAYAGLLWMRWKRTEGKGDSFFPKNPLEAVLGKLPGFVPPSESELLAGGARLSEKGRERERRMKEAVWEQGASRAELEARDTAEEVEVAYEPAAEEPTPRVEDQLKRQMREKGDGGTRSVMGIDISHVTDVGTADFAPPEGASFAQRQELRRQEREAYLFGKAGTRAAMDPDWWLDLPFVCVIEMTHGGRRGLWGLDVDPARGHVDAVPKVRTFAFEDRDDAQRFCWMLRTRQHSVDQMPSVEAVPPGNLWEAVDKGGNKVCVVPKGGPIFRPGRTIQDVEADLLSLAGFTEWGVDDIVRMYGGGEQVNLDDLL